jgi:hypothetical protein
LSTAEQRKLGALARDSCSAAGSIQRLWERAANTPLSMNSIKAYWASTGFRYKRYRLSLRAECDIAALDHAKVVVASLQGMAKMGQCSLLYFDESGFSSNPLV